MKIGLEIAPVKMVDLFQYHRQLFYYPHPEIIDLYTDHFANSEDYENNGKVFIEACLGEYWLDKPSKFYEKMIQLAYNNGDKANVVELYKDILDYSAVTLSVDALNSVLDSASPYNVSLVKHALSHCSDNHSFCTSLLLAGHKAANPSSELESIGTYLGQAVEIGRKTGDVTLVKSEIIKNHLLAGHTQHNTLLQNIITEFSIEKVCPEDPEFYDWKYEAAPETPESSEPEQSEPSEKEAEESSPEEKA